MNSAFEYRSYLALETYIDARFDSEKWFTFRIMDPHDSYPEYRIEIEKNSRFR